MNITDENYLVFCMHHYDNPHCAQIKEFEADVRIVHRLRRLLKLFKVDGELRTREIMNNVVTMYNVFGTRATDIMLLKLGEYAETLVPFISALNYLPKQVNINGRTINPRIIEHDKIVADAIAEMLRG